MRSTYTTIDYFKELVVIIVLFRSTNVQVTEFVVKTGSHSHVDLCSDKIESGVFLESFITVAAAIPSNIFAVIGMDTLGRKFFLGKYHLQYLTVIDLLSLFHTVTLYENLSTCVV